MPMQTRIQWRAIILRYGLSIAAPHTGLGTVGAWICRSERPYTGESELDPTTGLAVQVKPMVTRKRGNRCAQRAIRVWDLPFQIVDTGDTGDARRCFFEAAQPVNEDVGRSGDQRGNGGTDME
jgi:hypothetical protein